MDSNQAASGGGGSGARARVGGGTVGVDHLDLTYQPSCRLCAWWGDFDTEGQAISTWNRHFLEFHATLDVVLDPIDSGQYDDATADADAHDLATGPGTAGVVQW